MIQTACWYDILFLHKIRWHRQFIFFIFLLSYAGSQQKMLSIWTEQGLIYCIEESHIWYQQAISAIHATYWSRHILFLFIIICHQWSPMVAILNVSRETYACINDISFCIIYRMEHTAIILLFFLIRCKNYIASYYIINNRSCCLMRHHIYRYGRPMTDSRMTRSLSY